MGMAAKGLSIRKWPDVSTSIISEAPGRGVGGESLEKLQLELAEWKILQILALPLLAPFFR